MDPVAVRVQNLGREDQALTLARIAEGRSETGLFAPRHLDLLFAEFGVPGPANVSNQMRALEKDGLLMRVPVSGNCQSSTVPTSPSNGAN